MTGEKTPLHGDHADKVPTLSRLHDIGQTVSGSDEDIRGRMVKDKDGQDIGKIEHLLIDDAEQKVRFMEVASGGFLHLGETKSFIPVEHVAGAPSYDPDLVLDLPVGTHDLFGLYPYDGLGGSRRSWAIPTQSVTRPLGRAPSGARVAPGRWP